MLALQWGHDLPFWGNPDRLLLLLIKASDVKTNPDPTTSHKQVWICDICHKQIHVRKQISIRCNRIELWMHLRCASIRQAQYTDTWTYHLHKESGLTAHLDTTPPFQTLLKTFYPLPPTPPQPKHRHTSNTPPVLTGLVKPKPNLIHTPPSPPTLPRTKNTHISHNSPTPLIPRTTLIHCKLAVLNTIPEPRVPPTCLVFTRTTPHQSPHQH